MKKRWIITAIGAAAGSTAAFFLKDEGKRQQVMEKTKALPGKFKKSEDLPIKEAGNPEEQNHENAKMVSEGSQFGVQYYNDLTEKEREIIEKSNS
ncbi:hypothetical protein [Halobacillus massiliensis]|uniref:hypothetical protein n=1 Tax=Halobacillus massiliensis TaxID=1926286 RepID=UPI0009E4EE7A|nr:hypothetical protein [Halobacillus massiliensis]